VARIAGVLTICGDRQAAEISDDAIAAAITLVRHYLGEAARIDGLAGEGAALRRAQAVLDHLKRLDRPVVHLADVYQYGPAEVRDAASARAALRLLQEHGHLEALQGGAEVDGRHHRAAWRIVAAVPPNAASADVAKLAEADAEPLPDGKRSGRAADRVRGSRDAADVSNDASRDSSAPSPAALRASTSPRRREVMRRGLAAERSA
ncbi:MAG TPA: hypothetical protein VJ890_20060, partial [Vineibacter sp.]|nr:hypothetical protein [Vineibacter sp.]